MLYISGKYFQICVQVTLLAYTFFFQPLNSCQFETSPYSALDDVENNILHENFTINLPFNNFITASTAAVVGSFSFVFVAFIDESYSSFITGVSQFGYIITYAACIESDASPHTFMHVCSLMSLKDEI